MVAGETVTTPKRVASEQASVLASLAIGALATVTSDAAKPENRKEMVCSFITGVVDPRYWRKLRGAAAFITKALWDINTARNLVRVAPLC